MVPSASSKYYVYGGGRWRELDTVTGRVSGWRGARLCVARRGRLVVQRGAARRRLLAALRALAAGGRGTGAGARDGPRLLVRPPAPPSHNKSTRCRCCCHHNNNNDTGCGSKAGAQRSLTSDACVQAAPPSPAPARPLLAFPSSAVSAGRHLTTVATVHSTPRETRNTSTPISPRKRRNSSTSWKHGHESSSDSTEPIKNTNTSPRKTNVSPRETDTSPRKKANLSLKRKRWESDISSDTSKDEISISQSILKKDFDAKYLRSRAAEARAPRIRTRVIHREVVEVSSDNENKDPTVDYTHLNKMADTETEDDGTKHKSIDLFSRQKCQMIQDKMDVYRELVISEDDVDVLRRFMIKNNPQFDIYKYDSDDSYKAKFFYSINPLVSIEPCPKIVAMLEGRDTLSLQQFASQLGLRSVSDGASSPGRALPRKRRRPPPSRENTESHDSEDKENLVTTIRRSNRHKIVKRNTEYTEGRKKLKDMSELTVSIERLKDDGSQLRRSLRSVPRENNHRDNLKGKDNGSGEEKNHLNNERRKRQRKVQKHQNTDGEGRRQVNEEHCIDKQKVTTEKKVTGARPVAHTGDFRSKEYSSLEDHAIVGWISTGDRAKLVNGNRVWRMLEQSFEEIGGRARSWHSLRNRYLRYLLPALGHLELPATQQARLRAAAALGEIKGKKHPPRRNSIYGEPARGASSRNPRLSPRYSDVTRQFAARHPLPSSSSSSSSSSASEFENPTRASGPRTRTSITQARSPRSRTPNTRTRSPRTRTPSTRTRSPRTRTPSTRTSNTRTRSPRSRTPNTRNRSPRSGTPNTRTRSPRTRTPNTRTRSPRTRTAGPRSRTRKLYNPNKL